MKTLIAAIILVIGLSFCVWGQNFPDDFYNSEKHIIKSKILNTERLLFIYLPNDYYKDTTKSYPVHYLSDAPLQSNIYFDLLRLHGLMNAVPQCIVVSLSRMIGITTYLPIKVPKNIWNLLKRTYIQGKYRTRIWE